MKRNETKFGETEKETLSVRFAKIIETNKMPKSAGIMTETHLQAESLKSEMKHNGYT